MITSVYSLVDMAMVGQYQGPDGTAALAVVAPVWNIIYSLGLLMGIGGSVVFSNLRGKSEENHKKSITVVTLGAKGQEIQIEQTPLAPLQEVRRERGQLEEIIERANEKNRHDFVSVTLTDEKEPYRPKEQLEEVYDFILELRIDNTRTRNLLEMREEDSFEFHPMEAFRMFYQEMQGQDMSGEEEEIVAGILEQWEER